MKDFENIEERCIGVSCKDGYFPLGRNKKVITDKTKDLPEGTYIGPDFKPTDFTDNEKKILFYF